MRSQWESDWGEELGGAGVLCSVLSGQESGGPRERPPSSPLPSCWHLLPRCGSGAGEGAAIGGWQGRLGLRVPWPWVSLLVKRGEEWGSCCKQGRNSGDGNQERRHCAGARTSASSCPLGGVSPVSGHHHSPGSPPLPPAFSQGPSSIPSLPGHTHQLPRRCRDRSWPGTKACLCL